MDGTKEAMPTKPVRSQLTTSAPNVRSSSLLATTLLRDKPLRAEVVKGKSVVHRDQTCRAKLMWEIGAGKFKRNLLLVLTPKNDKKAKDINVDIEELRAITQCARFPSEMSAAFSMHVKKKSYHCVADNEDDMFGWVAAIQAALEENKVQGEPPLLYHVTVIDSPGHASQGERLMEFSPRWQPHSLVFRSPLNQVVVYSMAITSVQVFGYSSRTGHLWLKTVDGTPIVLRINGVTAAHVARVLRVHVQDLAGELEVNDQLDTADRITFTVPGSGDVAAFYTPTVVLQCTGDTRLPPPYKPTSKANTIHNMENYYADANGGYETMSELVASSRNSSEFIPQEPPLLVQSKRARLYEQMKAAGGVDREVNHYAVSPENNPIEDMYDNTVLAPVQGSISSAEYDQLTHPHLSGFGDAVLSPTSPFRHHRSFTNSSPDSTEEANYDRLFAHVDDSEVSNLDSIRGPGLANRSPDSPLQRTGGRRFGSVSTSALPVLRHHDSVPAIRVVDRARKAGHSPADKPPLPGEDSDEDSPSSSITSKTSSTANIRQQLQVRRSPSYSPYEVAFDNGPQSANTSLKRRSCSESNLAIISLIDDTENYLQADPVQPTKYKPGGPPPLPPDDTTNTSSMLQRTSRPPPLQPLAPFSSTHNRARRPSDADIAAQQSPSLVTSCSPYLEAMPVALHRARSDSDLSKSDKGSPSMPYGQSASADEPDDEPFASPGDSDNYVNFTFHRRQDSAPPYIPVAATAAAALAAVAVGGSREDTDDQKTSEKIADNIDTSTTPLCPPVPKPRKISRASLPRLVTLSPPPVSPKPDRKIPKKSPRKGKPAKGLGDSPSSSANSTSSRDGAQSKELEGVSVAAKAQLLAGRLKLVTRKPQPAQ